MGLKFWKKKGDKAYQSIHKRFVYLDDDITISNLSALESGKIDKIVETINSAEQNSSSIKAGISYKSSGLSAGVQNDSGNTSSTILQAQVVRTRTSVSIFQAWLSEISKKNAIKICNIWNDEFISALNPGDLIRLKGGVAISQFETGLRTYLEVVNRALEGDALFIQIMEGENSEDATVSSDTDHTDNDPAHARERNKRLNRSERAKREEEKTQWTNMKKSVEDILGGGESVRGTVAPLEIEKGVKTKIAFRLSRDWLLEPLGDWSGNYTIIAQIDEILSSKQQWRTLRFLREMPITSIEENMLEVIKESFSESMQPFFNNKYDDSILTIDGPLVVLRPVAIYR